ncbi:hypothetical protein MAPG_07821 [Magnaporthiopsis poae ATCC 64411]|uniref:Uncharacterized protein n=1 Tax=Magnaporthiopsis poae (strain ATCC 64411 / 73-15) TaxID=644358 RepID=A0A0C4E5P7_MAGP6|nr:hypothetical protein MAPG_07821 [Magnaporthiopsis poae ATCC 64411]
MASSQQTPGQRAHVARHVRSHPADEVAAPRPVKQASRVGDGRRHTRNHASADNLHYSHSDGTGCLQSISQYEEESIIDTIMALSTQQREWPLFTVTISRLTLDTSSKRL